MDPDAGLYYGLEALGEVRRLTTDDEIEAARTAPPPDTRAALRGFAAVRFPEHLFSIRWDRVTFKNGAGTRAVDLGPFVDGDPRPLIERLETLDSPADFVRLLEGTTEGDTSR